MQGCRLSTSWPLPRRREGRIALANRYQNRIELLQGTLDLLILQTLRWGPQHGYGISQAIRLNSGDILQVDTGSLYPALHRLERQKWIAADWKLSENKQRVRVYRLTAAGKKRLLSERSRWAQLSDAIAGVLEPVKKESEA
jgi:PadR family transcriptional regulator PadR